MSASFQNVITPSYEPAISRSASSVPGGSSLDLSALHVAIIMDGSGRWALERGLPRSAGHQAGVQAVRRTVEAAATCGLGTLTLYAFSADNWQRPPEEVSSLMRIFLNYILDDIPRWVARGLRFQAIGRRDRIPAILREALEAGEAATEQGKEMRFRLAIDYSGRDAILRAAQRLEAEREATPESFARSLAEAEGCGDPAPDIDLLVRTGGEQRLSDCVLWDVAYAEFVFSARLWPDFDQADFEAALQEFLGRDRRFGRIPVAASE